MPDVPAGPRAAAGRRMMLGFWQYFRQHAIDATRRHYRVSGPRDDVHNIATPPRAGDQRPRLDVTVI